MHGDVGVVDGVWLQLIVGAVDAWLVVDVRLFIPNTATHTRP